jgi:diguanylate cyclase (GGDEF)-like protein
MDIIKNNKELLASMSVLYVEDDEVLGEVTREIFEEIFKSVDYCKNPQEALIQYTSKTYDIVITDMVMPVMSGLDMAREIKYINPSQYIVLISAHDCNEYFKDSIEIGIDAYLFKPLASKETFSTMVKIAQAIYDKKELQKYESKKTLENSKKVLGYKSLKELLHRDENVNIILLDVDNFSNINDSYGLEYGDLVLERIEKTLHDFNYKDMNLYSLQSDEFALISTKNIDIEILKDTARFIISYFNESELLIDDDLNIKISFSIAIASGCGFAVLNNARMTIKELREHTRGTFQVYDMKSSYMKARQDNVYWINKIQESVAEDNIVAFFQPIVNNKLKKVEKFECLARIYDDGEYVSPFLFMQAAKYTRVISNITKSIIKQSCKMFAKTEYEFSINITNDDLQMQYLEDYLLRHTKKYNIATNRIVLELLEDISTLDKGNILEQLGSLKEKGFKLAIDDFGSESSNFSRLLEFNPDYLKIDGSFIKNILTDDKSLIITEGIVYIAHKRGIKVIAEYIHNKDVQDKIDELGIDYSQGYYHGAPSKSIDI